MEIQASQPFDINQLRRKQAGGFQTVYCNHVSMAMSFFDASLTFGEISSEPEPDGPNRVPFILEKVTVTMTWEQLKGINAAIASAVANYESVHGAKIRTPESSRPIFNPGPNQLPAPEKPMIP